MQVELTRMMRRVPFVPFTVTTRNGEVHTVDTVERMSVGRNVCAYIDPEGFVRLIPYHTIDHVTIKDAVEPNRAL